jgi:iron complex transport system substrate-binding protein
MKRYRIWFLVLGLVIFGACGGSRAEDTPTIPYIPASVDAPTVITQPDEPETHVLVIDFLGREVLVPINPTYVAAVYAPTTILVAMMGKTDTVVAIANGTTRDVLFMEIYPQLLDARQPRGSGVDINVEVLFADPVPEVIFLDAVNVGDPRIMGNIELFGVPVVAVEYYSLEGVRNMVRMMGEIFGTQERAAAYITYLDNTIALMNERLGHIPDNEKKIVYHATVELLRTNTRDTLPGDWMPLVGLKPAFNAETSSDANNPGRHVISLEELLMNDPEYIIITGADVYDYIHSERGARLHVLQAYRNDKIFLLPMGVSRWGHHNSLEVPLNMMWLAQVLYPELFDDIDLYKEIKYFYRTFFDYELDDETVDLILDGRTFRDWRAAR